MKQYPHSIPVHPVCVAFPAYSAEAYATRLADYKAHPERAKDTTVVLAVDAADGDWKVADGRHHLMICEELGYESEFTRFTGTPAELADFVLARNAHRRHETESQRAASIAAVMTWVKGSNQHARKQDGSREPSCKSQQQVADEAGIGRETLKRAAKVAREAPELLPAVRDGKLDAKTAATVADLPKERRQEVADSPDPKQAAKKTIADAKDKAERSAKKIILQDHTRPDAEIAKEIGTRPQVVAGVRKTLEVFGRIPEHCELQPKEADSPRSEVLSTSNPVDRLYMQVLAANTLAWRLHFAASEALRPEFFRHLAVMLRECAEAAESITSMPDVFPEAEGNG